MRFGILGPFVVADDDGHEFVLGGRKLRSVLAILLLHHGEVVSSDRLIDLLWGEEPPRSATKTVQVYVFNLRKVLGDGVLLTRDRGYLLDSEQEAVDAHRFESLVARARGELGAGDPGAAVKTLHEALALWRGDPLADLAYEPFAQAEIARLQEARIAAFEDRLDAQLALGEGGLVGELEVLVHQHPLRERLRGQLMRALYQAGRQADALEAYQRFRALLDQELGLEPGPALTQLQTDILQHAATLQIAPASSPSMDPMVDRDVTDHEGSTMAAVRARPPVPASALIGREEELLELCRVLQAAQPRLVTLVGPGGVGKTRLALAAVGRIEPEFPDGVFWVELAGVAAPEDLPATLARALAVMIPAGEDTIGALARWLAGRCVLVVLDNFERLLDASDQIARLLAAGGQSTILATSRAALDIAAEMCVRVEPLALPGNLRWATVTDCETAPATALFIATARRRGTRLTLDEVAAPHIASVCARLDGLPLALELAAARTTVLDVGELALRLEHALIDLGSGPRDAPARQQTLTATIDWSYQLLDEAERDAAMRFAVFAGGATLRGAELITAASLQTLESLLAKSVLHRRDHPNAGTRLGMLETVREYSLKQLDGHPDADSTRRRHFEHYLTLVQQTVPLLNSREFGRAAQMLDQETDNIRTALQWALTIDPAGALRLTSWIAEYWVIRAYPDTLRWLDTALATAADNAAPEDRARAQLYRAMALFYYARGSERAQNDAIREAQSIYRQLDDHAGLTKTLWAIDLTGSPTGATALGRLKRACHHARRASDNDLLGISLASLSLCLPADERDSVLREAVGLLEEAGDYRSLAMAYVNAAWKANCELRPDEALRLSTDTRAFPRALNPINDIMLETNVGDAHLLKDDLPAASTAWTQVLRQSHRHGVTLFLHDTLFRLGAIAAGQGDAARAARLLGAASHKARVFEEEEALISDQLDRNYITPARTMFGPDAWARAKREGAALTLEQAIAYALETTNVPTTDELAFPEPVGT